MSQQETVELPVVAPPPERNLWLFGLMWFGQLISGIGSGLTTFAMGVWVYQQTGSATRFTFIALLSALPSLAMMPVAGALVDRWDKRWTMILSNCASALCMVVMLLVTLNGRLDIWHIYLCVLALSVSGTLQGLAYYPAITLCVPKRLLGRVSGMTHASQATTQIAAPLLGGLMIAVMGIQTIFLVDFVTYLFGIVTLLIIRIPVLAPREEAAGGRRSLLKEALYGWTYVRERTSLLLLMLYFASTNFLLTMALVLLAPMVLSFTTPQWLGTLNSVSGVGLLAGSLAMTTWGGPKDRGASSGSACWWPSVWPASACGRTRSSSRRRSSPSTSQSPWSTVAVRRSGSARRRLKFRAVFFHCGAWLRVRWHPSRSSSRARSPTAGSSRCSPKAAGSAAASGACWASGRAGAWLWSSCSRAA
jgi:MFS family permease